VPDNNARKRLKKKMLDRWENEGGRIAADPMIPLESNPVKNRDSKGNRPLGSRHKSTVDGSVTPTKKRKLTQK
jgi:hypothetical protein